MLIRLKNKDTLELEDFEFRCCVGKRGLKLKKKEGDFCTPKGQFKLISLYYRADRIKNIKCNLPKKKITKNMGWCNDPKNKKYNSLINIKNKIKHEKMYRKDNKYDLLIVLDYNFNKPIPYRGSAIFLHLTKNYKPTAGCVAIKQKDMFVLLKIIDQKTKINIT